jgi:lysozyme family protein
MDFNLALAFVLDQEGGYVHHPADPGGETNYGITKAVAVAHGYRGPLRSIPMDWVRRIYQQGYWDRCRCEAMPEHPIRLVVFDAAIHSGVGQSIKWLQRELGVAVDGLIGPVTLAALQRANLDALAHKLINRRLEFLRGLRTWKTFGKGWSRRIAALREALND